MKNRDKDDEESTRISIRVSHAFKKELDDKRHALGEDWQSLGMRLWQEWLRSTRDPAENFYTHHRKEHEMLDDIFYEGTKKQRQGIEANLEAFHYQIRYMPQRSPEGQRRIREQYRQESEKVQADENQDPKKKDKAG